MNLTSLTDIRKDAVLQSIRNGATIPEAARAAGISKQAVYWWIHNDDEFAKLVEDSRASMVRIVWGEVFRMAITEHYEEIEYDAEDKQKKRVPKIRWPHIGAMDMILRNYDPNYKQRLLPTDNADSIADLAKALHTQLTTLDQDDMEPPTEDG